MVGGNVQLVEWSCQIPSEISHLSKLIWLDFPSIHEGRLEQHTFNMLLQNPIQLRELHLDALDISSPLPHALLNLSSLTSLNLASCQLRGKFSKNIFHLPNLQKLEVCDNKDLTSKLSNFNIISSLQIIDLSRTSFSGQVPDSISNLKALNSVYLIECNFSGSIPASLGNLNKSPILEVDKLLKLTYLSHLDLSHNGLSLSINNSVNSAMPKFYTIGLASCNLSKFPNFLRVQAELLSLDLSNNKIGGEVPKWVFDVGKNSLKDLDLSNNFLSGLEKLPWQTLQFIDLHSNLLHGPLPIPPITTIAFFISNNKLIGEIFPLICSLNLLKVLDLSNNNFSGIIPHCFGNLSNSLSVLNSGMNSFHGTFTTAFTVGLVLRFNRFHGHIDAFKTKSKVPFTKLRIIDISYNEFSGLWPTNYIEKSEATMNVDEHAMKLKYMGDIYYYDYVVVIMKGHEIEFSRILTIISIIDLSSNKFIGEIPKSIGRLNSLQDLNLSHNNLKGHIPTSLGNLKSLESLDLSSNKLTSLMFLENNEEDANQNFTSEFNWKVVVMGYGYGFVFGMVMGYLMFVTRLPEWLMTIVEGGQYKKVKRSKKSTH
ncbi:hypothetical protein ACSBR1_039640 [Camellia fascicularis]